ncbi:hypothetical protein [Asticcacaulis sp. AND118]|uniref:hypothetical protein n=1 Tax=Asticcacaulis sp. AND118 TaxID=2840468 RepID=UPI001D000E9F|nr:hypothetical protein [Asticcacaulis sp. AND118]UDF02974.1 hypothetical protein LH365_11095 [Asticcacaulis sp. AND118]
MQLGAFADRMLLALTKTDDPETGEDIEKGIRRALLIERLYSRVDASEARGSKQVTHQVAVKAKPAAATASAAETPFEIASRALAMKARTLRRAAKGDTESLRQVMARHIEGQNPTTKGRDTS